MDTNTIETRLKENIEKEIKKEVFDFLNNLKNKYGKFYDSHNNIDLSESLNCGKNKDGNNFAYLRLSTDELSLQYIFYKVFIAAYSKKLLNHKVNELIKKIEIFD